MLRASDGGNRGLFEPCSSAGSAKTEHIKPQAEHIQSEQNTVDAPTLAKAEKPLRAYALDEYINIFRSIIQYCSEKV